MVDPQSFPRWQQPLPTMYDLPSEDPQIPPDQWDQSNLPPPEQRWQHPLPTMYDLPSEDPEEPGLPDEFHALQPQLLSQTCQPPDTMTATRFMAQDLNLYYDARHPQWYKRPDWFLVLGARSVERQEELRWSYVVWQEGVAPFVVVELLSPGTEGDDLGEKERDPEKPPTKWDVYEKILRIPYYVVFDRYENRLRVFQLNGGGYQQVELPDRKLWLAQLGLGIGVWEGKYNGVQGQWLRWYDNTAAWIPTPMERAEAEAQRAEAEAQRADRAEQLQQDAIPRLAAMGLTAAQIATALSLPIETIQATLSALETP